MRTVTYNRGAEGEFITLRTGHIVAQRIDLCGRVALDGTLEQTEMSPENKIEALELSRQWAGIKDKTAPKTAVRRQARVLYDLNLAGKVADYASKLAESGLLKKASKKRPAKKGE